MLKHELTLELANLSIKADELWQFTLDKPKLINMRDMLCEVLDLLEQCETIAEEQ